MKFLSVLLASFFVICVGFSAPLSAASGVSKNELRIGGRDVIWYAPYASTDEALPLIILMHGGLGNNEHLEDHLPLYQLAGREQFHVVYIEGSSLRFLKNRRTWNAGACCALAMKNNVDDVDYIADVIDYFVDKGGAAKDKIILGGTSNGAMMSYRFACERPQKIRGIIPMSGFFAIKTCPDLRGVRVYHIHGDSDDTVPIEGGGKGQMLMGAPFPSLRQTEMMLKQSGARYHINIVAGGGHGVDSLDSALKANQGIGLSQVIANVIFSMLK